MHFTVLSCSRNSKGPNVVLHEKNKSSDSTASVNECEYTKRHCKYFCAIYFIWKIYSLLQKYFKGDNTIILEYYYYCLMI